MNNAIKNILGQVWYSLGVCVSLWLVLSIIGIIPADNPGVFLAMYLACGLGMNYDPSEFEQ